MAYERREFPFWSWSQSRRGVFEDCTRMYYYQYYGSHNGWEDAAPAEAQKIYRLKNLTNLYLTFGEACHQAAVDSLRRVMQGRGAPGENEVRDRIRQMLNDTFRRSRDHRERWERSPKRNPMLHEMYYDYGPSDRLIETIKERIDQCVPGLLASHSFREAASEETEEILSLDQLDHFMFEGTKVYAVPDLLYRRRDGWWVIVDWKTGSPSDDHVRQLETYALYVLHKFDAPAERILGRVEYLLEGDVTEVPLAADAVQKAKAEIRASIAEMQRFLVDPQKNKAYPIEYFPMREDTRACPRCNFYELCKEALDEREAVQSTAT